MIKFKFENIKFKKRMSSGSCLTSKLSYKIIKMPSKSHENIPLMYKKLIHPVDTGAKYNS
jgi:hypothetical protein